MVQSGHLSSLSAGGCNTEPVGHPLLVLELQGFVDESTPIVGRASVDRAEDGVGSEPEQNFGES